MQTMNGLLQFLETSYTPYHAVANAQKLLDGNGFVRLYENDKWEIKQGGKYYAIRGGSALIAFTVGEKHGYLLDLAGNLMYTPTTVFADSHGALVGEAMIGGPADLSAAYLEAVNQTLAAGGKDEISLEDA